MPKTTSPLETPLRDRLQTLAAFEPRDMPVVSLYLNLAPDQHGRDNYEVFCRKAFTAQVKAFEQDSAERASLERDVERINEYLANQLDRSANGLALFASAGSGEFFEAVQLEAVIDDHALFIGAVPHLYPLVRLIDQYPRYAVVALDTNQAKIFVFGLGVVEKRKHVEGVKTRRSSMGGWSQARYQRRTENFHLHHIKEVVETLDRTVRAENIQHVIVAGDEVVVPLLKDQLPAHLTDKIVDVLRLDRAAGEDEILETTLEALRRKDAETDRERVAEVISAWHAGGLGVVGPEATMRALDMGQVDELLIAATPDALKPVQALPEDAAPKPLAAQGQAVGRIDDRQLQLSDELVTRAERTAARVRILEDVALLRDYGGVAAALRFRI